MNKEQTLTGVIRGTGACVPKRVMDNDEIAGFVETSDEWIRERTGVERRHIAEEETTVSMAVEAGRQAVEDVYKRHVWYLPVFIFECKYVVRDF